MIKLDLQSERYVATGNIASEGLRNQLGRPAADPLAVLVRETVQNSWDALSPGADHVVYSIHGWKCTASQMSVLRDVIFTHVPRQIPLETSLRRDESMPMLCISDRGTCGLGGPTRADMPVAEGEASHFVNFVRNVGKPKSASLSGGTYGYGKSCLYNISNAKAICIHTRCRVANGLETRFICIGWGSSYSIPNGADVGAYTGRHWWGKKADDGVVDPLIGEAADLVAASLGLPSFGETETGLNLLVVDPNFGTRESIDAIKFLEETVYWYFWPKMMASDAGLPPMKFRIGWENHFTDLMLPSSRTPFTAFVQAMKNLKAHIQGKDVSPGGRIFDVLLLNPKRHLGYVSLVLWPANSEGGTVTSDESPAPFHGASHHVALMRGAELVVKYMAGPPAIIGSFQWAGVFIPLRTVDASFAAAEPPAHDDWIPAAVSDPQMKKNVNVALKRIKEIVTSFAAPNLPPVSGDSDIPLGAFAEVLGNLLPTATTLRPDGAMTEKAIRKKAAKPKVIFIDPGTICDYKPDPAISMRFSVTPVAGSKGSKISMKAQVAIVDGSSREAEPPSGESIPHVLQWWNSKETPMGDANEIIIPPDDAGVWIVAVSIPGESAVTVSLEAESVN